MSVQWLPISESSSTVKGSATSVTTADTNTRTTNRGQKVTTNAKGAEVTTTVKGGDTQTMNRGAKTTTRAEATFTRASTTTLTEDAGGVVSFSVIIRGGLGVTGVAAIPA